jgi:hypothetical protein
MADSTPTGAAVTGARYIALLSEEDGIPSHDALTSPIATEAPPLSRTDLVSALIDAHRARRGVPVSLEPVVRAFARAERDAGVPVERVLVELKRLLAETVHADADLFAKRVVGWAVAGYYDSSAPRNRMP